MNLYELDKQYSSFQGSFIAKFRYENRTWLGILYTLLLLIGVWDWPHCSATAPAHLEQCSGGYEGLE